MSRRRPTRAATWFVAVLLLAVLAGCARVGARPAAPTWTPPPPPRVLVLGDSYTAGHGASPATAGFAYLLRGSLGWDVTVDGVGGSGYLATGNHGEGSYLTRLARAAPGPFDLVLLQGGSNDEHRPVDRLEPAVAATVTAASKRYPGARVALMGPVAVFGVVTPEKAAVHGVLERYAAASGLAFVDPIDEGWFVRGDAKTMVDRATGHPDNAGYGRIRDRFVIDATRLGLLPRAG